MTKYEEKKAADPFPSTDKRPSSARKQSQYRMVGSNQGPRPPQTEALPLYQERVEESRRHSQPEEGWWRRREEMMYGNHGHWRH